MNCEHKRQDLLDYVYGELSSQHTEQVSDTVHSCPACRTELERIELVRSAFGDAMPMEEVPHAVHANILREARLKAYTEPPSVFERLQKLLFHPGFAAAAAVALVLVISGVIFQPTLLQSPADDAEMAMADRAAEESAPGAVAEKAPAAPAPVAAAPVEESEAKAQDSLDPEPAVAQAPASTDNADQANAKPEALALGGKVGRKAAAEPAADSDGADGENVWKLEDKPVARLDKRNSSFDDLLGKKAPAKSAAQPAARGAKADEPKAEEPKLGRAELDKAPQQAAPARDIPPQVEAAVVPADLDNLDGIQNDAPAGDDDAANGDLTVKQAEWNPQYRPGNAASRAKAGSNSAVGFGNKDLQAGSGGSLAPNSLDGALGGDQAAGPPVNNEEGEVADENVARKRFERGLSRYQRGDYGNAVQDFDAFMNDAPRSSNYYALAMYYKGRSLLNRGNSRGAAGAFRSVIDEYPQSEKRDDARYWLAKSLLRADPQNGEAQQILEQLMSGKSAVAGNARETYDRSFGKSAGKEAPKPKVDKRSKNRSAAPSKKSKGKSDMYESPDEKALEAVE